MPDADIDSIIHCVDKREMFVADEGLGYCRKKGSSIGRMPYITQMLH